ncbi:macrophage-expressed gene 1 protein-like [Mytilus edulis]|uniref:macrophage-expressed gene 1 protein-like n=1 Tax=Mytilus edulis TaxID=6550 RepID=UPI0039EEB671
MESHSLALIAIVCVSLVAGVRKSPEECFKTLTDTKQIFEVLPGVGWDNLQNTEQYRVLDISYNECQTTADRKFLVPDGFTVEPVKTSEISIFADTFSTHNSFTSATSASVNKQFCASDSTLFEKSQISGSYSNDAQFSVNKQLETDSTLVRVTANFPRYRITIKEDAPLDPVFRRRLQKIAAMLDTNQDQMATFESELLTRDYGTHVLSDVLVGGLLVKNDYIIKSSESTTVSASDRSSMNFQAGQSFNKFFFKKGAEGRSFTQNNSKSATDTEKYANSLQYSKVTTYGGPVFNMGQFSMDNWEKGLESNLVAIDRRGQSLFDFINPYTLPEMSPTTVFKVENLVLMSSSGYYKHNSVYGCTDPKAINFNSKANIDDGTCGLKSDSFSIGGFFQTCEEGDGHLCDHFSFVNPRTNQYSCPAGYRTVRLWKAYKSYGAICRDMKVKSLSCSFLNSKNINEYTELEYSVYWCSPNAPQGQPAQSAGFLFGGMWNPSFQNNPVTGGNYCPSGFSEITLGVDLHLCYGNDVAANRLKAVTFGGLFSSMSGNPLAGPSPKNDSGDTNQYAEKCPGTFSKYLATVDENVDIYYCSVHPKDTVFEPREAIRPPFMKRPLIKPYDLTSAMVKMTDMEAATINLLSLTGSDSKLTAFEKADLKYQQLSNEVPDNQNNGGSNGQSSTTIIVVSTVAVGAVMLAAIVLTIYIKKRRGQNEEYTRLTNNLPKN